jgi:hypothetical protein
VVRCRCAILGCAILGCVVLVGCASGDLGIGLDTIDMAILPQTATIYQGDSSTVVVSLMRSGSSGGGVSLDASGAPVGVTIVFSEGETAGPVTRVNVGISVSNLTRPGVYPLMLRATGTTVAEASATFNLDVVEWPPECAGGSDLCGQWALRAAASSQFSSPGWGASQATGEPDVAGCADDVFAWASLSQSGVDWLELTFPVRVRPTEIRVFENYGVSSIVKVEVKDASGSYQTVYTAQPGAATCPRVLTVPVTGTSAAVNVVRLHLDQRSLNDWNEIDAVRLIGYAPD